MHSMSQPGPLTHGTLWPSRFRLLVPTAEGIRAPCISSQPALEVICRLFPYMPLSGPGSALSLGSGQVKRARESMSQEPSSSLRCDRSWWTNTPTSSPSTGQSVGCALHSFSHGPHQDWAPVTHGRDLLISVPFSGLSQASQFPTPLLCCLSHYPEKLLTQIPIPGCAYRGPRLQYLPNSNASKTGLQLLTTLSLLLNALGPGMFPSWFGRKC